MWLLYVRANSAQGLAIISRAKCKGRKGRVLRDHPVGDQSYFQSSHWQLNSRFRYPEVTFASHVTSEPTPDEIVRFPMACIFAGLGVESRPLGSVEEARP
jgi:hypothetical protein